MSIKNKIGHYIIVCVIHSFIWISNQAIHAQKCQDFVFNRVLFQDTANYEEDLKQLKKFSALDSVKEQCFDELLSKVELIPNELEGNSKELARYCFIQTGLALKRKGLIIESLEYYQKAHDKVVDKDTLDYLDWWCENVISTLYTRLGDFDKDLYFRTLVNKNLKRKEHFGKLSRSYNNSSILYRTINEVDSSYHYAHRGLELAKSEGNEKGILSNLSSLISLEIEHGKLPQSYAYLRELESNILSFGSDKYLSYKLTMEELFAAYYNRVNKPQKEENYLLKSIENSKIVYGERSRERAKSYLALAKNKFKQGKIAETKDLINKGFDCLRSTNIEDKDLIIDNSSVDLLSLLGDVSFKEYLSTKKVENLEEAHRHYKHAREKNEKLQELYLMKPSQLFSADISKKLLEKEFESLFTLYQNSLKGSILEELDMLIQKTKGSYLQRSHDRNRKINELSPEIRDTLFKIAFQIEELFTKKENVDFKNELLKLEEQRNSYLNDIESEEELSEVEFDYIEYAFFEQSAYRLAYIDGIKKLSKLDSIATIKQLVQSNRDQIVNKKDFKDTAKRLYSLLMDGVEVKDKRLLIIPDEVLQFLPFETLLYDTSFLIDWCTIWYAPSRALAQKEKVKQEVSSILLYAPEYEKNTVQFAENIERGTAYHLPFAAKEIEEIKALFTDRIHSKIYEEGESLYGQISSNDIFHYSGHATVDSVFSYLLLPKDKISANEIGHFTNNAAMVNLSACETGLGKLSYGEGLQSLGRAFLEGGTSSVVQSLWTVNDVSTQKIMTEFYNNLIIGYSKSDALREAKLNYINSVSGKYQHPYYWAPFIGMGQQNKLTFKKESKKTIILIFLGGFMTLLLILLIKQSSQL